MVVPLVWVFVLVALSVDVKSESVFVVPDRALPSLFNKCYDEYGCFTTLPPFGGTWQRPVALLPQSPSTVATRFFLYTREHPAEVEIGRQKSNLGLGTWQSRRMTRLMIHGMIEDFRAPWYDEMRQALLDTEDSNVIFVDWSRTNHFPYTQATANTQIVGAEVSLLINELISVHGADPMLIHVIGHSLGAHAAGYAGSRISPRVGRITGLDPAGPYFEMTDPRVRLDPSDARFVDVIHTDGQAHVQLGLGLLEPLGHVDFYPNGGLEQPKCPRMTGKIWNAILNAFDNEGFVDSVLCSHLFSVYTFTDSIRNSRCSYVSVSCSDMDKLKYSNECSRNPINRMGLRATPSPQGTFYLSTQDADHFPYCQHLYSVTLHIGNDTVQKILRIQIALQGSDHQSSSLVFDQQSSTSLKANSAITRLLPVDQSLGDVYSISIDLKSSSGGISEPIRRVTVIDIERQKSFTLCPTSDDDLRFELC